MSSFYNLILLKVWDSECNGHDIPLVYKMEHKNQWDVTKKQDSINGKSRLEQVRSNHPSLNGCTFVNPD